MISFVNGFLCTSSCDAAKAKRGVDPHPDPGSVQDPSKPATKDGVVTGSKDAAEDPAVVLGGSLATSSAAVDPPSALSPPAAAGNELRGQIVNFLV